VVRIRTRQLRSATRNSSAASSPVRPGISMSSRATSGLAASATGTTSSPRATWATTEMSFSSSSSVARAPRTMAWSSAIMTRITSDLPAR
jgi:hypothetical protein